MMSERLIVTFTDEAPAAAAEVGGKGANLRRLVAAGLPVPDGFIITTAAFARYAQTGIEPPFVAEVVATFNRLGASHVAVRSSAVVEDAHDASWAGQFESYLNVTASDLVARVQDCWNSTSSERVGAYSGRVSDSRTELSLAVVVQKMVDPQVSGVLFTANPITGSCDEIVIEGAYGLGELIVQGAVIPDHFVVARVGRKIKKRIIGQKSTMLVRAEGGNVLCNVDGSLRSVASLTDAQVQHLVDLGIRVEEYFGSPQDIEWALSKDELYLLQARPITTSLKS